jgi:hypothetical protein
MKKRLINTIKYLFFLGLGLFLVWLSIHNIRKDPKQWSDFTQSLSNARFWLIIPVFVILCTAHYIRALRWKILMEPMGYKPAAANAFFAVMIGYLANMAVPRLGEILKCTLLAKYEKVPAEKIVGTIVAERVFDVLSLGIVFLLAFTLQFEVVQQGYLHLKEKLSTSGPAQQGHTKQIILLAIAAAAVVLLALLIITKKLQQFFKKVKHIVTGVWEGVISVRKLRNKWLFIFYSVAIWFLYLLGTWIGFYATISTSGIGFSAAISCLAFASIGMIITPGGIGAYAYFLAITLELQQNSTSYAIGYANGTIQWFAQFAIILVVGFVCLGLLPWYNKRKTPITQQPIP